MNGPFPWTPPLRPGESLKGYLHSLARENMVPLVEITKDLDISMPGLVCGPKARALLEAKALLSPDEIEAAHVAPIGRATIRVFGTDLPYGSYIHEKSRLCLSCLREGLPHQTAWNLRCVGACLRHGEALVDACPKSGCQLFWWRDELTACSKGHDLTGSAPGGKASPEVLELAAAITARCGCHQDTEVASVSLPPAVAPLDLAGFLTFLRLTEDFLFAVRGRPLVEGVPDRHVLQEGWGLLRRWPEALEGVVAAALDVEKAEPEGFRHRWSKFLQTCSASPEIGEILRAEISTAVGVIERGQPRKRSILHCRRNPKRIRRRQSPVGSPTPTTSGEIGKSAFAAFRRSTGLSPRRLRELMRLGVFGECAKRRAMTGVDAIVLLDGEVASLQERLLAASSAADDGMVTWLGFQSRGGDPEIDFGDVICAVLNGEMRAVFGTALDFAAAKFNAGDLVALPASFGRRRRAGKARVMEGDAGDARESDPNRSARVVGMSPGHPRNFGGDGSNSKRATSYSVADFRRELGVTGQEMRRILRSGLLGDGLAQSWNDEKVFYHRADTAAAASFRKRLQTLPPLPISATCTLGGYLSTHGKDAVDVAKVYSAVLSGDIRAFAARTGRLRDLRFIEAELEAFGRSEELVEGWYR